MALALLVLGVIAFWHFLGWPLLAFAKESWRIHCDAGRKRKALAVHMHGMAAQTPPASLPAVYQAPGHQHNLCLTGVGPDGSFNSDGVPWMDSEVLHVIPMHEGQPPHLEDRKCWCEPHLDFKGEGERGESQEVWTHRMVH